MFHFSPCVFVFDVQNQNIKLASFLKLGKQNNYCFCVFCLISNYFYVLEVFQNKELAQEKNVEFTLKVELGNFEGVLASWLLASFDKEVFIVIWYFFLIHINVLVLNFYLKTITTLQYRFQFLHMNFMLVVINYSITKAIFWQVYG